MNDIAEMIKARENSLAFLIGFDNPCILKWVVSG
jgi:hypothetical protein